MKRYRVAQVGLGARGSIHLKGFLACPDRYELVAVCDLDKDKLAGAAEEYGVADTYADAGEMLAETKPDVFCFVTQPDVRLALVELAVEHAVKGLAFEKPMATTLREAWAIADACRRHAIKAVVCHQHKYLTSMQRLKEIVDAGEVGEVSLIHSTSQAWLSQLGTHYMDYILWMNGGVRATSVVGHVHGKLLLQDSHPSPDYIMGQAVFENGVRAIIECGDYAPRHMQADRFWVDNRLTVYGTHGYAWADTDGNWSAFTKMSNGKVTSGTGKSWECQERESLQAPYLSGLADWLDDDAKVHPCNVELAYHGYEILEGMCLSALDNARVSLPLVGADARVDVFERMRGELPETEPVEGWSPP